MKKKIGFSLLVLLLALVIGCGIYVGDYYHADQEALTLWPLPEQVERLELDAATIFVPEEPKAGLIFYPGGKVEAAAYEPLLLSCAEEGVLCILTEMPFNLAVLDMAAADGLPEQFPQVEDWYLAGHSLGGSMAAAYLEDRGDYDGLILLGSYSTADLSDSGLRVLSLYGSEDRVLNRENYEAGRSLLPADFMELVLEGGNHAGFGLYGPQEEDGVPRVSTEEQIRWAAENIVNFITE